MSKQRGVTKTVDLNEKDEVVVDVVASRIGVYGWRKNIGLRRCTHFWNGNRD